MATLNGRLTVGDNQDVTKNDICSLVPSIGDNGTGQYPCTQLMYGKYIGVVQSV